MDQAVFNLLAQVQAEQDDAKREDLRKRTNATIGAHFRRYPMELEELAFDILNLVWHDTMEEDIVPQIIQVKNVGLAEPDYVEEDLRGGRAYWQGKGGQILSGIIRYQRTVMPREEMVTALDFHQDEIVTNFWGTFDKLVTQAQEKLRQLPTTRLIELIRAALQMGGPTYGEFAYETLSAEQIDTIVQEVAVKSKGQVTILGTQVAVRLLANVGLAFGYEIQQQIFNTGQIGVYKGYPVVQVENFEDFHGHFVLPNDELWIVGQNCGRLTYYGDVPKVQQMRREAFYTRWETGRDAGMLLYGAPKGRMGRIVLT